MAQTPVEKATLALRLLMGMKRPAVQEALRPYGFGEDILAQGWELLVTVGNSSEHLEVDAPRAPDAELKAFQKRWFPIVRVVLRARFAGVQERMAAQLRVQHGLASALSVACFLSQLAAFASSEVAEERALREVLRSRGLTESVEQAARACAEQSLQVVGGSTPQNGAVSELALSALWAWYLEWRGLCRTAITNKNLLRALGLPVAEGRPKGTEQPVAK